MQMETFFRPPDLLTTTGMPVYYSFLLDDKDCFKMDGSLFMGRWCYFQLLWQFNSDQAVDWYIEGATKRLHDFIDNYKPKFTC